VFGTPFCVVPIGYVEMTPKRKHRMMPDSLATADLIDGFAQAREPIRGCGHSMTCRRLWCAARSEARDPDNANIKED